MDNETEQLKKTDEEFEEYTLEHVTECGENGDSWDIEVDTGWHLQIEKAEGHTPEAGQVVRFYGKGIGYSVRGVDIEDFNYYYKTIKQHDEEHKKYSEDLKVERKKSHEENKDKYKAQYDGLPDVVKKRMDRLIKESPDTRYEWESYELYILTEAVKIFNALKTPEAIEKFHKDTFEAQKKAVPDLDEGHSGNTFGGASMFAYKMAKGEEDL